MDVNLWWVNTELILTTYLWLVVALVSHRPEHLIALLWSPPHPSQGDTPRRRGGIPPSDPLAPGASQRWALSSGWDSAMSGEPSVITTTCAVVSALPGVLCERVPVQTVPQAAPRVQHLSRGPLHTGFDFSERGGEACPLRVFVRSTFGFCDYNCWCNYWKTSQSSKLPKNHSSTACFCISSPLHLSLSLSLSLVLVFSLWLWQVGCHSKVED